MSVTTTKRTLHDTDEEDGVRAYIRDIEIFPLLTAEEEVELAQRIEQGDSTARKRMIEGNLRLVISIARKYTSTPMPMLDRIQYGNIGLMRAVEKYDYRHGCKFSTYATWWIHQSIGRNVSEERTPMHVPVYVHTKIRKMQNAINALRLQLKREPTQSEIAATMGISVEDVYELHIFQQSACSLDAPLETATHLTLKDVLEDATDLEAHGERVLLSEAVQHALEVLSERERVVIQARFGIGAGEGMSLRDIGAMLGCSGERVRQKERDALAKLHRPLERMVRQWNEVAV